MRKQTKLAVGFSAAALLAVGASMTSLAATGWTNEGGSWYYYNSNGDYVTDSWKSYNGQYFYLGDDGAMLTSQLIEDGDNHYYVDANGAMVKNTWVAVPADDDETLDVDYRWYYFGSTGKAYRKSYGKTINGKKYGFDEDGKMLFGYVEDASYNIINDDEDPILNATYYFGTNEDGARHSGWLQYTDALADHDDDYYWFYFNTSNGKKVTGQTKSVNGKKYSFDSEGIMDFKWSTASFGNTTGTAWYGKLEDGALAKNQWIWNKPYGVEDGATLDSTTTDKDDETQRWFRTDASGKLVKGQTKKVNSKWYAFDEDGVMRTGLIRLDQAGVSGAKITDSVTQCYDMDTVTKDNIKTHLGSTATAAEAGKLHYFSEDEEKDGSMKTGTMKIELADDEYTFCFAKTTGAAKHGFDSSSKKVYNNGILLKAGDDKYVVVEDTTNGHKYLVGTTGNVVKNVNKYKDANDKYFILDKSGNIYETYDEDAAKAAVKAAGKGEAISLSVAPATK